MNSWKEKIKYQNCFKICYHNLLMNSDNKVIDQHLSFGFGINLLLNSNQFKKLNKLKTYFWKD
jgi:hypothetical protein